ncbi:MAG TPA: DUF2461 domain-containing protein [Kofleriaceae bacterium]|nr:DUF2461 domain-containing protein [Kofleriaceae bacterium]
MPKAAPKFVGFDRDALQFLHELTLEMNREWFEANKARYQARWVEPMTALLGEVAGRLAKVYAPIKLGPPKLFRIYRDTRFSKDKSPYKTHVAGVIPLREGCTAMYMHIGIDDEFVGVGTYYFEDSQLPRWRKLVAADKTGKEIAAIVTKLRKAGYKVGGHEDYKKVPKGFDPEHPRAEFLKMRGLTGGFPAIPKGLLHKPALADWLFTHAKATAPMVSWLYRNVK